MDCHDLAHFPLLGLVYRKIEYAPGLYKIFDELLVNAADNYQRDRNQTTIRVEIDAASNTIVVYNDGRGSAPFPVSREP